MDYFTFPVELRPGVVAKLRIPHDMAKDEAEKICRVIMSLVTLPPNRDERDMEAGR